MTGQFKYVGDMTLPHMLHAKVLFSPVAHARIKSIDTSQAEQLEGVRAVVCWKNAPDALFNSCGEEIDGEKTERVFDSTVRYVGDKVAAVAADTAKIAEQALKLIRVEYEELPYYLEPEDALKEGAYPIHKDSNVIEEVVQGGRGCERRGWRKRIISTRTTLKHLPSIMGPLRRTHPWLSMRAAASSPSTRPARMCSGTEPICRGFSVSP